VGLDSQLDRALGGLDGKLASEAKAYSPGAPEVDQVEALRAFLFPVGVAGITRRSHVEELELTKGLLARADQRKDELGAYGATNVIARIASLVSELEAALKAEKNEPIAADDVRAATLKGNALVADIVVQILNKTRPEADASAMARRQALLRPILAQDAIMYEYNRQSRKALDVDPATAEEVETDEDG